jgi:hypothetical protein
MLEAADKLQMNDSGLKVRQSSYLWVEAYRCLYGYGCVTRKQVYSCQSPEWTIITRNKSNGVQVNDTRLI